QLGRAGKILVAGASRARLPDRCFQEEILREAVGEPRAIDHVALEVLDAADTDEGTQLKIFGLDARSLDFASLHLRLDDRAIRCGLARDTGLLGRDWPGRCVAAAAEPCAAGQHARAQRDQKKNAKPRYFHSSTSSLSPRPAKMTLFRYSERNMKRRVR